MSDDRDQVMRNASDICRLEARIEELTSSIETLVTSIVEQQSRIKSLEDLITLG